ncbi:MAG TPA: hypothetical protein VNN17_04950 [Terriglobia bacterium]|nr:hypothetical protein [Terriglobia bacterium]
MGASDNFPLTPDYAVQRAQASNLLRGRSESAREFRRQKGPRQRLWALVFNGRPKADWEALEYFYHKFQTDFFSFTDPTSGRKYSCYFHGEPAYQESGNESFDLRAELIEAAGVALDTYPSSFTAPYYVTIPVASAQDLGANGKLFVYAGYGYRVNGTFTSIYLDEILTGGENPKTDVVLGLHRVRVVGGTPTSLDYLI